MRLAKDQIALQFSRAASTYDLASQLQNEMADRLIGELPASATGTLVDLGCGTGWALKKLAQLNRFKLTAVDLAPGMIEVARSRVPTAKFHCCDLEKTPLESNSADIVFSNATIQWCDVEQAIQEMYRICKPSGSLLYSTFGPRTLLEIRSAWQSVGDETNRVHDFNSTRFIESCMNSTDFKHVSVSSVERQVSYDSVDGLLQSIKQMGATNASTGRQTGLLGTSRYHEFRGVFEQRLESDGFLELTFECIFAQAQKS